MREEISYAPSSNIKKAHAKMRVEMKRAIKEFEEETGFMVVDCKMERLGPSNGYRLTDFHLPVIPFGS